MAVFAKSDYELKLEAEQRDAQWRERVREVRAACEQECPAGYFVDRAHLVELLGHAPTTNRPYLAFMYLVVHGARALGVPTRADAKPFNMNEAVLDRFIKRDVWWDPPPSLVEGLPSEYRSSVVGAR
jgi:hypothetical protein